jgi:hypothetical protein
MALRFAACIVLTALAGCASTSTPSTQVMGAGPACDLSITVGEDHRCPVQHVSPDQGPQLITNGTHLHD